MFFKKKIDVKNKIFGVKKIKIWCKKKQNFWCKKTKILVEKMQKFWCKKAKHLVYKYKFGVKNPKILM